MAESSAPCRGYISSDDDQNMSNEDAMEVIKGLVAETGYFSTQGKKKKAAKKCLTRNTSAVRNENFAVVSFANERVVFHYIKEELVDNNEENRYNIEIVKNIMNDKANNIVNGDQRKRKDEEKKIVDESEVRKEKRKVVANAQVLNGPKKKSIKKYVAKEAIHKDVREARLSNRSKKRSEEKSMPKDGKQQVVAKSKLSNEIKEERAMGAMQYTWKTQIRNAKSSANNVMHFPRTIAKRCLRTMQDEIKLVDVEKNEIFNCQVHTARRNNQPSTHEKYMTLGWYEFAQSKNLCNGDTLVWSMLRFSPYMSVKVDRS